MTASERFSRIVSLVAELTRHERDGGDPPTIGEVAARLGVPDKELKENLRTLTLLGDRAVDSDWLLSLRISQQADRLSISSAGPFQRPVRLSPEEQLAIQLALAMDPDPAAARLAKRFAALWSGNGAHMRPTSPGESRCAAIDAMRFAIREHLAVDIEYAGEGERDVRTRSIHPYQIAEAGIRTYVVAWANDAGAWRHFRLDRVISVDLTTTHFHPRTDFVPLVRPLDAFRPATPVERVMVRFRREAAPWVTEFYSDHEILPDGSVLVRFDAANPDWLIRRVLEFGPDAEVVEPARYRDAVRRAIA